MGVVLIVVAHPMGMLRQYVFDMFIHMCVPNGMLVEAFSVRPAVDF